MPPPKTHPDWILFGLALIIALGFIVGTSLTTGYDGSIVQGDARAYFAFLPSLVFDRDVVLNNEFETLHPEGQSVYPYGQGPRGRAANPFPIAPAVLWLPGYLLGVGAEALAARFRAGPLPPGYGAPAVWGAATASIVFAGIGAILTRRLIAVVIGDRDALGAVLATWLGTAALYYTLVTPLYSHAVSWFGVAATLYLSRLAVTRPLRPELWFASGLAAGWMVAIRLPDASLLIMPALIVATSARRLGDDWQRFALCLASWTSGLFFGYLPQGAVSLWLYGRWSPAPGSDIGTATHSGTFFNALFSTGYEGWVSWTPLIALAIAGLVVLTRHGATAEARRLGYVAICGVSALYLMDVLHPYGRAGAAYGGRRYVSASPLVAIGIAGLFSAIADKAPARRFLMFLIWLLVAWNLWLFICYEVLVNIFRVYPTLLQTARFAIGLGRP